MTHSSPLKFAAEPALPIRTMHVPIHEHLRAEILNGDLRPGVRIDEEETAARLGISRTPVREALRRLDHDGLVRIKPWRGAFVVDLDKQEILELLELREPLEGAAARLAAARASADDIAKLHALASPQPQERKGASGARALIQRDRAFHQAVYEATGNRTLMDAVRGIDDRIHLVRLTTTFLSDRKDRSPWEIAALVDAIAGRDGARAEELARQHVRAALSAAAKHIPEGATLSALQTGP